jgi:hypothetical protein
MRLCQEGERTLGSSTPAQNLVDASLFNFLLQLEEARAVRLQYCFSLLRLRLHGPTAFLTARGPQQTRQWASLLTGILRNTDIVVLLPEGSIGILLIDADADVIPAIVARIADALDAWADGQAWQSAEPVTWSAGAASYPRHGSSGTALLSETEALMLQACAEGGGRRVRLPEGGDHQP